MENTALKLEDILTFMHSKYIPELGKAFTEMLPKEMFQYQQADDYARQFLYSFYSRPDDYKKAMEFLSQDKEIGPLEKSIQESFSEHLNRNEAIVNKIALLSKNKKQGEKLTLNDKYLVIRNEFKTAQEYLAHLDKGLQAYLQTALYVGKLQYKGKQEELENYMAFQTILVTKYAELLMKEAKEIYGSLGLGNSVPDDYLNSKAA